MNPLKQRNSPRSIPSAKPDAVWLSLAMLGLCTTAGCRIEHAPSRAQLEAQHVAKVAVAPMSAPPISHTDDAQLVIASCGAPSSDQISADFDKLNNGPIRRMVYKGRQAVTLEFIPSTPTANLAATPAPLPHVAGAPVQVPAGAVWRFDQAHMEIEELLTARRLAVYLPCAATALKPED